MEQVRQALEMYRSDNGFYPMTGNGVAVEAANGVGPVLKTGNYLQKIPVDPKSVSYVYQAAPGAVATQGVKYCIWTDLENNPTTDTGSCSVSFNKPADKDYGLGNP
jgi:type II secretory pathway pseudopilin PulG